MSTSSDGHERNKTRKARPQSPSPEQTNDLAATFAAGAKVCVVVRCAVRLAVGLEELAVGERLRAVGADKVLGMPLAVDGCDERPVNHLEAAPAAVRVHVVDGPVGLVAAGRRA